MSEAQTIGLNSVLLTWALMLALPAAWLLLMTGVYWCAYWKASTKYLKERSKVKP